MINVSRLRRSALWSIIVTCMILIVIFIAIAISMIMNLSKAVDVQEKVTEVLVYSEAVHRTQILNNTYFINAMSILESLVIEIRTMYPQGGLPTPTRPTVEDYLEEADNTKEKQWENDFQDWVEESEERVVEESTEQGY